ncbi:hypothetical protein FB45DRAFT_935338 [Roridomyces roridus]|uniref:RNI-like protein n=1 Tax=Roridomyces roridus TaxID=1738132 RepID=A0AAD7BC22_9AGAR|nr:hypothetical protein FB45DRAFT_935338 [Roridomyces roridus]
MSLHSPSLGPSSPSPSSSAVIIPIPGRSILKKPPPPQAGLFSRLSTLTGRFLPTESPAAASGKEKEKEEERVLKRAHFILPEIAVVYPISALAPPSTPALRDEKRAIEDRERERRRRIVRSNSMNGSLGDSASVRTSSTGPSGDDGEWWAMDKVESFYRECCEGCQEPPDKGLMQAFKNTPPTHPRSVDFSGVQLTLTSASILADVLSIEWGLRKATFKECDLDEVTLKPILHALLIPNSLTFLSLASNRRLRGAWKLVGAYLVKAHSLTFLDVSSNALDKKAVEYIVGALGEYVPTPSAAEKTSDAASAFLSEDAAVRNPSNGHDVRYGLGYSLDQRDIPKRDRGVGLVSLKLDDCSLRAAALESLSRAVRTSSLRNISLRHNRIGPTGAVALALMIRDYPDVLNAPVPSASSSGASTPQTPSSPVIGAHSLPSLSPPSPTPPSLLGPTSISARNHPPPPPPRHPSQTITAAQTTYTPYVPRRRQQSVPVSSPLPGQPVVASSVQGGVTARHVPVLDKEKDQREKEQRERERAGPSAALLDKVRALDALPRVGALRTLDLKGNDLKNGITYIAQVLKRNRTLKVLNLSDNKLDVACLVSLAEALKYNSCLETLDLSRNPCSGPGLEGIQSLRTAFTLNSALKRLFLSATGLQSPGAIALAEFLPESASLLHLDLTDNTLGLAGVLALSKGIEANFVMRCLDLNIPPGDEACARMCRDILNVCVRNTERAERAANGVSGAGTPIELATPSTPVGNGNGRGLWGMIEESELAKSIRLDEEKKIEGDVALRARVCMARVEALLVPPPPQSDVPPPSPASVLKDAKELIRELGDVILATEDPTRMEELLIVNDELTAMVARVPPPGRPTLTLQGLGLKWAPTSPVQEPALANGHAALGEEDGLPTTPRVDKGKARAIPEPEEPEKVLSPTLLLEEEDEDRLHFSPVEEEGDGEMVVPDSPTNRSRSWVEEEGEVFRKGNILLGPEEMDGEYAGDELRIELLEAMVERPPPRPVNESFGIDASEQPQETPASPVATSPVVEKPPPRPYISRRGSSSSIMSVLSPTLPSFPKTVVEGG